MEDNRRYRIFDLNESNYIPYDQIKKTSVEYFTMNKRNYIVQYCTEEPCSISGQLLYDGDICMVGEERFTLIINSDNEPCKVNGMVITVLTDEEINNIIYIGNMTTQDLSLDNYVLKCEETSDKEETEQLKLVEKEKKRKAQSDEDAKISDFIHNLRMGGF